MQNSISDIFSAFQKHVDNEQDIREEIRLSVKTLEQSGRELLTILQGIHQPDGVTNIPNICKRSQEIFKTIQVHYSQLSSKVPKDQYYRFHDHWRFSNQRLVFLAALTVYLDDESLITQEKAAEMFGVAINREDGFHIDLEDYLMGLLLLGNELSRFSVTCVTSGDYGRPVRIAKFVTDLSLGFRLLNLKNDSLRKKFDALKYDLKRIEEVVYDLSIRGLKVKESE